MNNQNLSELVGREFGVSIAGIGRVLGGYSSINTLITAQDGTKLVLKSSQEKNRLRSAMKISSVLGGRNTLIPVPLVTRDGAQTAENNGWAHALLPFVDAEKHHGTTLNAIKLRSAASALAAFHSIGLEVRPLAQEVKSLSSSVAMFKNKVDQLKLEALSISFADADVIISSLETKHKYIEHFPCEILDLSEDTASVIHGDFHNENILFQEDDVVAILDFENVRLGDLQHDLASFVHLACCNDGFSDTNLHKAKVFVSTYAETLPDTTIDMRRSFRGYACRRACSTALEETYMRSGDSGVITLLQRDIRHLSYIASSLEDLAAKIQP